MSLLSAQIAVAGDCCNFSLSLPLSLTPLFSQYVEKEIVRIPKLLTESSAAELFLMVMFPFVWQDLRVAASGLLDPLAF